MWKKCSAESWNIFETHRKEHRSVASSLGEKRKKEIGITGESKGEKMTRSFWVFGLDVCPGAFISSSMPFIFLTLYFFAFLVELCRVRRDGRTLRVVSLASLLIGLALHTVWILKYTFLGDTQATPGASQWFFVLAWGLAVLTLSLFLGYPKTPFGVFLFPAIFLAIPVGSALADARLPETSRLFGTIHAAALLAATVFLFHGFVIGVMFFLQRAKIKSKTGFLRGVPFPSLEWLGKANRFSSRISLSFLTIGVFFGLVLCYASAAGGTPVSGDLMILGGIFLLLFLGILLPAVSKSDQSHSDARTAVLNIVGFLILIFVLGYGIVNSRAHWLFPRNTVSTVSEDSRPEEETTP
jgi:hypothetical protein